MTNNLQSNIIEKEHMFDKATGKFNNYICGDDTVEMLNANETIALKIQNKSLKEENKRLVKKNLELSKNNINLLNENDKLMKLFYKVENLFGNH